MFYDEKKCNYIKMEWNIIKYLRMLILLITILCFIDNIFSYLLIKIKPI